MCAVPPSRLLSVAVLIFCFFFYILLFIFLFDITKTLNKHSYVTDYMIYTKKRIKTSVKQQSPSIAGQLG